MAPADSAGTAGQATVADTAAFGTDSQIADGQPTADAAVVSDSQATSAQDGDAESSQAAVPDAVQEAAPAADLPSFADKLSTPDDQLQPDAEPLADAIADVAPPADVPAQSDLPKPDTDAAQLINQLPKLALAIVIGDSVGAGYNASGLNASGGQGFGRLLFNNHSAWPKYQGHDLHTLYPNAQFMSLAKSGATSGEMLSAVQSALSGSLPKTANGDVLVVVNVGGNDFNDNTTVMISGPATEAAATKLRQNVAKALQLLKDRYNLPPTKKLLVVINAIHDPTDGKATVPKNFTKGFCKALQNPLLLTVAATVMANLGKMNAALKAEALAQSALFVDLQAAFQGHGMNSGPDRWIDDDCAHPINAGHDLIRRQIWLGLTGQQY